MGPAGGAGKSCRVLPALRPSLGPETRLQGVELGLCPRGALGGGGFDDPTAAPGVPAFPGFHSQVNPGGGL